jgi:MSHA pilin protein MshA
MKRQAGFTLIELVMVIVILGILSAFALPRFADLGGEAREAAIQGAFGAIKSASSIAHADSLVNSNPTTITLEGETIDMLNGYPQAIDATAVTTTGGILEAAQITAADYTIDATNAAADATGELVIQATGATTPADCSITYTAAAAGASPTIRLVVTGCG